MRNPWVAIMTAAFSGKGLHLTADEVSLLADDSAIEACALNDVERVGSYRKFDWADLDPRDYPVNPSLTTRKHAGD